MSIPNPPSGPNESIRPQIVYEPAKGPIRVVVEPPRRRFGNRLLWFLLILSVVLNVGLWGAYRSYFQIDTSIEEKYHSLSRDASDKVAVITVEGMIYGEEGFVRSQIDRVRHDPDVRAVVLRVDSPGGTVTGSDYIYHQLKKLTSEKKIPLVVSMGSVAASGGYYISMAVGDAEKTIYAEPTTWTGSIGVVIPHYDFTGLLDKLQIQDDSIASNPMKLMGSPTRKFSEPERVKEQEILRGLVDSSFEMFKEIVLSGRPALRNDMARQQEVFTGRVFTATQAKEKGLIDEIGFLEDAISRAVTLAGLRPENVRAVKYTRPQPLMEQILVGPGSRAPSLELARLLNMTTPRAYFLLSWMPGLEPTSRP